MKKNSTKYCFFYWPNMHCYYETLLRRTLQRSVLYCALCNLVY